MHRLHTAFQLTIRTECFTSGGMTKEVTFVRLEPSVKRALERVAKSDERSLSSLISKIVADWMKAQKGKDGSVSR